MTVRLLTKPVEVEIGRYIDDCGQLVTGHPGSPAPAQTDCAL